MALKMNYDLEDALKSYIYLLKESRYFDAHEALEEAWHPLRLSKHPLANLLKGLINASIALEHIKRDKPNAKDKAKRVIASYDRHIHIYQKDIEYYELFGEAIDYVDRFRVGK